MPGSNRLTWISKLQKFLMKSMLQLYEFMINKVESIEMMSYIDTIFNLIHLK